MVSGSESQSENSPELEVRLGLSDVNGDDAAELLPVPAPVGEGGGTGGYNGGGVFLSSLPVVVRLTGGYDGGGVLRVLLRGSAGVSGSAAGKYIMAA